MLQLAGPHRLIATMEVVMGESPAESHVEQLATIARVLLGVAYADQRFEAVEYDTIRQILSEFMSIEELPPSVADAIDSFDAGRFDLTASLRSLRVTPENRAPLLRLVLRVADADKVREPDEKHYFHAVAEAIGAEPSMVEALLNATGPG